MSEAKAIKTLIRATGMNARSFSKQAQIPYTTLMSILERGISNSSVGNVAKICKALGITFEYLDDLTGLSDSVFNSEISNRRDVKKMTLTEEALKTALEVLNDELKERPLSPERVAALTETIKVLSGINPLSRP
ncbi:hypothetical protein DEAC_c40460 [Desulfosporosinus acididurans]|uniref:HTH cro/C1-type domain-containing protein n=1 Tax=Desulfosporosinus acididurans TaxID=476652 RepID=A0A0J1FL02_9FIRM|nr:helix-turn-helix transcriptional regulator [Desulfosporosinus acididurans]KLU64052.1 hypothetical protein DEAC_c40460 [Desulfosporosinus acididurans]